MTSASNCCRAPEYRKARDARRDAVDGGEPGKSPTPTPASNTRQSRASASATPETREVQQIVFPTKPSARGRARQDQGRRVLRRRSQRSASLTETDFDLGTVTKRRYRRSGVAHAAFDCRRARSAQPVKSRFGYALRARRRKVEPASVSPLKTSRRSEERDRGIAARAKPGAASPRQDRGRAHVRQDAGRGSQDRRASKPRTIDAIDQTGRRQERRKGHGLVAAPESSSRRLSLPTSVSTMRR